LIWRKDDAIWQQQAPRLSHARFRRSSARKAIQVNYLLRAAWTVRFYDPIILPDGRKLLTLRDAAIHHRAAESGACAADKSRWKRC